uniref:Uncharacterized protein n=1 Tax=Anopheles atroparvus TaxID=41427 RepID=A0A182IUA0_ANOAO
MMRQLLMMVMGERFAGRIADERRIDVVPLAEVAEAHLKLSQLAALLLVPVLQLLVERGLGRRELLKHFHLFGFARGQLPLQVHHEIGQILQFARKVILEGLQPCVLILATRGTLALQLTQFLLHAAICFVSSFRQLARSLLTHLISSDCSLRRFSAAFGRPAEAPLPVAMTRCSYSSLARRCSCRLLRAFSSLLSSPYAYCVAVRFLRTLFSSLLILWMSDAVYVVLCRLKYDSQPVFSYSSGCMLLIVGLVMCSSAASKKILNRYQLGKSRTQFT